MHAWVSVSVCKCLHDFCEQTFHSYFFWLLLTDIISQMTEIVINHQGRRTDKVR